MGNNYNFNINPKPPSDEQIASQKDFSALLSKLEEQKPKEQPASRPVYRMWVAAAAAAAAVLIVFFSWPSNSLEPISPLAYFADQPLINDVVTDIEPENQTLMVDAYNGGVYELESGSKLIIPSSAFVTDKGNLVEGEIEVYYRELRDQFDFFTAGIAMRYDTLGEHFLLESTGLAEVFAFKNGEPVALANGKSLQVELLGNWITKSEQEILPASNVYFLNKEKNTWQYVGVSKMEKILGSNVDLSNPVIRAQQAYQKSLELIDEQTKTDIIALEAAMPLLAKPEKPTLPDANLPTFELDFESSNIQKSESLQFAAGTIWQVSPNSPDFDQRAFQVSWEEVKLVKVNANDYELTFINPNKQERLWVRPVLIGEDYQNALEHYNQQLKEWQKEIDERNSVLEAKKIAIIEVAGSQKAKVRKEYEATLNKLNKTDAFVPQKPQLITVLVRNTFVVNTLGIYNCALPTSMSNVSRLKAKFVDEKGNSLRPRAVYLINKSKNTIQSIPPMDGAVISYEQNNDNYLLGVLEDGRIAVYSPKQFKQIKKQQGQYDFYMKVSNEPIASREQFNAFIER